MKVRTRFMVPIVRASTETSGRLRSDLRLILAGVPHLPPLQAASPVRVSWSSASALVASLTGARQALASQRSSAVASPAIACISGRGGSAPALSITSSAGSASRRTWRAPAYLCSLFVLI
jgi:hypothetical protein